MLDSCNQEDFFIQINEELSNRRARECHLSVTVDESRVPSFLCNIAARIFTCGKAVWLLKLFDPEVSKAARTICFIFIHYVHLQYERVGIIIISLN